MVEPSGDDVPFLWTCIWLGERNNNTELMKLNAEDLSERKLHLSKNLSVSPTAVMAKISGELYNANKSKVVFDLPKMSTLRWTTTVMRCFFHHYGTP